MKSRRGPWGVIGGDFAMTEVKLYRSMTSSIASMLNPTAIAGAGARAAGVAAAGTGALAGSIGGLVEAHMGAVWEQGATVAFAGASAILETGLTLLSF